MDENFTVVVASNECLGDFTHNANFQFSNTIETTRNVEDYEVALTSLTYHDRYTRPKPDPIPEPVVPTDFFDLEKRENEIRVEISSSDTTNFSKRANDLESFLAYLNTKCPEQGINIHFSSTLRKGVLASITLRANVPAGYHVTITDPLLSILGFEPQDFLTGSFESTLEIGRSEFDAIALNAPIGSVALIKRETSTVSLDQVEGTPSHNLICAMIVVKMMHAGYNIGMVMRKRARQIQYSGFNSIRMALSKKVNDFLGIPETFVFSGSGSIAISDDIIFPDKRTPIEPVKPIIPWSKILVMCDVIQDQVVAGKSQKLLAILERGESEELQRHHYESEALVYKAVSRPLLSQITISLKTDHNTFLDLCDQPTICVLHFRKKK